MKTLKYCTDALFVLAILFVCFPQTVEAQDNPPDSCLILPEGTEEYKYFNPDSVKIDTCGYSPTFGQWYATKFILQFKKWVNIFKPNLFIMDSIYTWEDIDSKYGEMKSKFRDLLFLFGEYYFKRHPLCVDDTSFIEVPTVQIIFDNYIHGETLIKFFPGLPSNSISYIEINQKPVLNSVIETENPNIDYIITITDNDKLNIKSKVIDAQGMNVHIYDLIGNLLANHIEKNDNDLIQIDISNLINGIYFVVINNKYIYKLIKY
ncbi:MAG: T9SS type A sorting domain-containing protein [Ignavibacteriae bacterium]|nr:T9SS type A sorting domain-containing protein [Ignavibacteriota bacterium]